MFNGSVIKVILKEGSASEYKPSLWEKNSLEEASTSERKLNGRDQSWDSSGIVTLLISVLKTIVGEKE